MSDRVEPPSDSSGFDGLPDEPRDRLPRSGPRLIAICLGLWVLYLALDALGVALNASSTTAIAVGVAIDMLMLALALMMQRGRNWARITLAVCGGVRLLVGLLILVAVVFNGGSVGFTTPVALTLLTAAIVTTFLPATNAWFAVAGRT